MLLWLRKEDMHVTPVQRRKQLLLVRGLVLDDVAVTVLQASAQSPLLRNDHGFRHLTARHLHQKGRIALWFSPRGRVSRARSHDRKQAAKCGEEEQWSHSRHVVL